jgi:ATP-GRASP peptide maturase of grasp-with-spasm system
LYFLLLNLREKRWLTNPFKINLNKPYVLQTAKNYGLEIPKTYIVNSASDLLKDVSLICKSILDPMIAKYENNDCMMYTSQISDADFQNLPARFLPSYIQEKIEKKYEVRIFYLNGRCYSMSIFSQKDIQTETDFRNYNWEKPNRFVPYQLPKEEGIKIKKLMQHLGLNCGSIDLIKAINDKYYFLEINPTGQFGMVDFPCNYGLHKKVAETLIEMDK